MKKFFVLALSALLFLTTANVVNAQVSFKSVYNSTSDTTVNTGTAYLTVATTAANRNVAAIQVVVTKISGTVAGTITLQGSLDGTNFFALTDSTTSPTITTKTATDVASQTFAWLVNHSPWVYYRISYTGSGTMSASFIGRLQTR